MQVAPHVDAVVDGVAQVLERFAGERDPSVVALGNGKFLVAYDKLSNGERRIAGRFVTFENRTHAVR